jgi:predicted branched-subunit amino acid permease
VDALPLIAGYAPFGFVLGATIADSGVPNLIGWASSPLVFAGASQLAIINLLDDGAALPVIVLTGLIINLRHLMYSGAIAPYFQGTPLWWRLAAPFVMADPVFTLAAVRFPELQTLRRQRIYWSVLGSTVFVWWSVLTALGVLLGTQLPAGLNLELAVPLVFLALLVPSVTDRPTLAAAIVGGLVTVAAEPLPLHLGLIVGALCGVVAGVLLDGLAADGSDTRDTSVSETES